MIKKYGTGLLAIIVAIAAFAFTKPVAHKPLATKIFQYQAPALNPYSEANVEKQSNWAETTLSGTTCNTNPDRACQLKVDDSFINPDHTLKSSFMIVASQAPSGNYYVSGGSASDIFNRD